MAQGYAPPPPQQMTGPPADHHSQNYFARAHSNKRLPNPVELANRLEEARTSANLLSQLVANTPSTEVLENELVREFADRCLSASRSIQVYMAADNPGPDNETMEALIDVNEQLQQALNNQKRAVLSARKELGIDGRSQNPSPQPSETNESSRPTISGPTGSFGGAPASPRKRESGKGKGRQAPSNTMSEYVPPPPGPPPGRPDLVSPIDDEDEVNPFRDPEPAPAGGSAAARGKIAVGAAAPGAGGLSPLEQPSLDYEPFHPGFGQPTQSYLGRQDSAMNKVQMHGAGSGSPERGELHQGTTNGGSTAARQPQQRYGDDYEDDIYGPSAAEGGSSAARQPQQLHGDDDEYDPYRVSATAGKSSSGKKPVYRY